METQSVPSPEGMPPYGSYTPPQGYRQFTIGSNGTAMGPMQGIPGGRGIPMFAPQVISKVGGNARTGVQAPQPLSLRIPCDGDPVAAAAMEYYPHQAIVRISDRLPNLPHHILSQPGILACNATTLPKVNAILAGAHEQACIIINDGLERISQGIMHEGVWSAEDILAESGELAHRIPEKPMSINYAALFGTCTEEQIAESHLCRDNQPVAIYGNDSNIFSLMMSQTRASLADNMRFLGVNMSTEAMAGPTQSLPQSLEMTVAVSNYAKCLNYFGHIRPGMDVGFIIKRINSTISERASVGQLASHLHNYENRPFQLVPYAGWGPPTTLDLEYYDLSGACAIGTYLPVGKIREGPIAPLRNKEAPTMSYTLANLFGSVSRRGKNSLAHAVSTGRDIKGQMIDIALAASCFWRTVVA